ncbi:CoA transferase [Escherichia coli]
MEKLIREADILVENFHPGAIDHMGFTGAYSRNQSTSDFFGSIKGFDECSPYVNVKAYEKRCSGSGWRGIHYGFLEWSAAGKRCSVG